MSAATRGAPLNERATISNWQQAVRLLKERAFRRGRIMLASGRESDFYFDMKPAMLDPDGAGLMAELILQEMQEVKADCVGGLEMGAVPSSRQSPCAARTSGAARPGSSCGKP